MTGTDPELRGRLFAVEQQLGALHGTVADLMAAGATPVPATSPAPGGEFARLYAGLEQWVEQYLARAFIRRPCTTFSWCAQWGKHPEAIARLDALWCTWEYLRLDPVMGAATWLGSQLGPQLHELTDSHGPFQHFTPQEHFDPNPDRLPPSPPQPATGTGRLAQSRFDVSQFLD